MTSQLYDSIGGFVTIPNTVMELLPAIGVDAFTLFAYLRYRTNSQSGVAFPSYDTIQADTGLTRRRIAGAIRALEGAELLDRRRRFGNSTVYTLKMPVVQHPNYSSAHDGLPLVQGVHTIKTDINKTEPIKTESYGAPAPAQPKPPKTQHKKASDPIPEAVQQYRLIANTFPDKATWTNISNTVGNDVERLAFWGKVISAYISLGWNKRNVTGMLEWFYRNELPHLERKNGQSGNKLTPAEYASQKLRERTREGNVNAG